MGKTQSKRSVDITTDPKKDVDGEIPGKLEKIEDIDQKQQLNGDAISHETADLEKKENNEETENDKDLTTEKAAEAPIENAEMNGEESCSADVVKPAESAEEKGAEAISPLSDDSAKKPKKEKVKKKWSLRNLSFSKKDKQKPNKNEEASDTATQKIESSEKENGEKAQETAPTAAIESNTESNDTQQAVVENGAASEKEQNGQGTTPPSTPVEETIAAVVTNEKTSDDKPSDTIAAATKVNCDAIESTTAVVTQENGTTESIEPNEKIQAPLNEKSEVPEVAAAIETAAEVESNGTATAGEANGVAEEVEPVEVATIIEAAKEEKSVSEVIKAANIPCSNNEASQQGDCKNSAHQNGDADMKSENVKHEEIEEIKGRIKANVEVKNSTDNIPSINISTSSASAENEIINDNETEADVVKMPLVDVVPPTESQTEITLVTNQPPPLPISPPPSQVSVFAFKADEDKTVIEQAANSVECDEPAKTELEIVVGVDELVKKLDLVSDIVAQETNTDGNIVDEIVSEIVNETEYAHDDMAVTSENIPDDVGALQRNEETVVTAAVINVAESCALEDSKLIAENCVLDSSADDSKMNDVIVEATSVSTVEESICLNFSTPIPFISANNTEHEEEIAVATNIVEDITKTAVEVVQNRLLHNVANGAEEESALCNLNGQSTNEQMLENSTKTQYPSDFNIQQHTDSNGDAKLQFKINSPHSDCKDNNTTDDGEIKQDCSSTSIETNLFDKLSLNDELDSKLNQDLDIASMDINDDKVVEITTQDLPVTCE